jgi:7,8-dihydroneopterin 2',3'-cyclic phosphate phosphodiesterase
MQRLIKLAKEIRNPELREKTIEFLKNIDVSNEYFRKYEKMEFELGYGGPTDFHHGYKGGLLDHTYSVTLLSLKIAEHIEKIYNLKINRDHLISAALLHDIMKVYCFEKQGGIILHKETGLDHVVWGCCELYAREFPEEVIHIVAAHAGQHGTVQPQSIEAWILFYADTIDATIENIINIKDKPKIIFFKE